MTTCPAHLARGVARVFPFVALALLTGCTTGQRQLDAVSDVPAGLDKPFQQALYLEYLKIAQEEIAEMDWRDGQAFYERALSVGAGDLVLPENVTDRVLPEAELQPMVDNRLRLLTALFRGGKEFAPADAARAQTHYDCLLQELEEDHQPLDILECRTDFVEALERVEAQLEGTMVVLFEPPDLRPSGVRVESAAGATDVDRVGEGTIARTTNTAEPVDVEGETVGTVFGAALAAQPADPVRFTLYFEPGTSDLTSASQAQLPDIAALALSRPVQSVIVTGHTDTVGPTVGNVALSTQRAEMVRQALIDEGVSADAIDAMSLGESRPIISTADNVEEPRNRRVEVSVQ